jgi:hypothetical protein
VDPGSLHFRSSINWKHFYTSSQLIILIVNTIFPLIPESIISPLELTNKRSVKDFITFLTRVHKKIMTSCTLTNQSFEKAIAGGPLLDEAWKCRVPDCKLLPGQHPPPHSNSPYLFTSAFCYYAIIFLKSN